MADTIKGLTVKIGADTSDFIKELKKVDREINSTQKSANSLQKGLELEFDEKRFTQAQKQVQKALDTTEQKAEAIRKQLKYLEDSGGVDTDGYEKLQLELSQTETKALQLKDQLEKIDELKFKNIRDSLEKTGKVLDTVANKTKIISIGAAGSLVGMTALAKGTASAGAELQDMADRLGVTAEALQRYDYIALQSGVETEQLVKAMAKSRDAIGTAIAGGSSTATKALEALFGDLSRIPQGTEEGFTAIVEKLSEVEDSTLQAYYANEIFGERMATNLIPLINNGADRLAVLNEEFESIGYLTNEEVQNLADLDDKLNIVNEKLDLAKAELGIAMIPLLETVNGILIDYLVPAMEKLTTWFDNLSEGEKKFVLALTALLAILSPTVSLISTLVKIIPNLITWLKKLNAQTITTSLGFASLAGALTLGLNLIADWKNMSTVEKILKSLALAALIAAGAITVFHASWSLGIAVGAITAGVIAGIAAIKAASEELGVDPDFTGIDDTASSISGVGSGYSPSGSGVSSPTTYNEDNSQYEINVNLTASGSLDYDSKALAEAVIKQIQIQKQSGGR